MDAGDDASVNALVKFMEEYEDEQSGFAGIIRTALQAPPAPQNFIL